MNLQMFRHKNGILILINVVAILLLYSLDIPKLYNRFTSWQSFGKLPLELAEVQYFIPDTPDVIGYRDPTSGSMFSCETTIAYIRTIEDETHRCCTTDAGISCLAGDFSSDILAADPGCVARLQKLYAIPGSLPEAKEYRVFAYCQTGDNIDIQDVTVVKVDQNNQIFWKYLGSSVLTGLNVTLKCIVAPLLLIWVIIVMALTYRNKKNEPMRKLW